MNLFCKLTTIFTISALAYCNIPGDSTIYTLYRSSTVGGIDRIHVATFDAEYDEQYSHENCELAADLFRLQPGIGTKFWCEKGRFHK